jgi:4-amino-4-deoxy-L-arabinose transferase-like glycosyltransferase
MLIKWLKSNFKLKWLLFALILLLGAGIRLYKFGSIPLSLYWDEAAMLVDTQTVAQNGHDMHGRPWYQLMYPSYGDYKLPVYIWLASLSIKIFGASEWALRFPSFLAGIGSIITAGLIVRILAQQFSTNSKSQLNSKDISFPDLAQLSTMLVVAITPWSIMFSRTAFEGHLAQFFLSCSILSLLQILTSKKKLFKILLIINSAILAALSTYTYFSVRFVWPIILIGIQPLLLFKTQDFKLKQILPSLKTSLLTLILPLSAFFLLLIPMFNSPLYQASNQFRLSTTSVLNGFDYALISNTYREAAGNTLISRVIFHRHLLLIIELIKNYADHLNFNFLFLTGDSNLRHGTTQHGLFLLSMLPLFIVGIYQLTKKHWQSLILLLSWWIAALLPASVPETTPHALRSLNALIPLSIFIGLGLTTFLNYLQKLQPTLKKITLSLTALIIALNSFYFLNYYFVHYPTASAADWQYGYKQVAQLITQEKNAVRTVWIDAMEARFYLWILGYSDLTAQQIQEIPKQNFQLNQINNIKFTTFDWQKLKSLDHKVMIVGEKQRIEEKMNQFELQPYKQVEIAPNYLAIWYEK